MNAEDREFWLANIGERIAEARERAGLTRRQLGESAGVDEYRVRSWEETLSRPTLDQLEEMAARCGATPDWLAGRDLIQEVLEEALEEASQEPAQDSFICTMGSSVDRLRLEDLEGMRESVLCVIQVKREGWKPAVATHLPREVTGLGDALVLEERPDPE